jgi:hypothetical protein
MDPRPDEFADLPKFTPVRWIGKPRSEYGLARSAREVLTSSSAPSCNGRLN